MLEEPTLDFLDRGVGCGSTFTIMLPSSTLPSASPASAPSQTLAPADSKSLTVLLVEDNLATQAILSRALKDRLGHTVRQEETVTIASPQTFIRSMLLLPVKRR